MKAVRSQAAVGRLNIAVKYRSENVRWILAKTQLKTEPLKMALWGKKKGNGKKHWPLAVVVAFEITEQPGGINQASKASTLKEASLSDVLRLPRDCWALHI